MQGKVLSVGSSGCILVNRAGDKESLVAAVGLKDIIVVQTGDALLVCHKSRDQDIKKVLQAIDADKKLRRVYR